MDTEKGIQKQHDCKECSCFKSCKRICLDESLKNLTVKCIFFGELKEKLKEE